MFTALPAWTRDLDIRDEIWFPFLFRLIAGRRAKMSIFDPTSGMNPLGWLQEKSLRALEEAARLVDLAHEKDTAPWYAKELGRRGTALIGRLAPMVALLHQAPEGAELDEWTGITERGAFALAAWCKKHDIQDPTSRSFDLLAKGREDEETHEKAQRIDPEPEALDEVRVLDLRCSIYASFMRRMLHEDQTEPARRMLLWALSHLYLGPAPDVVWVSRRFLPTDIGVTAEEAAGAYRSLIERGWVEPVTDEAADGDRLFLRLVVDGLNESKQPPSPGPEVTFGFPGARVGGKPTLGNRLRVGLPAAHMKALSRWRFSQEDQASLGAALQAHLGADRAYVESVTLDESREGTLLVGLRYSWDQDDAVMTAALNEATLAWVRQRVTPPT